MNKFFAAFSAFVFVTVVFSVAYSSDCACGKCCVTKSGTGGTCYWKCCDCDDGVTYNPHDVGGLRYRFIFYNSPEDAFWPFTGDSAVDGWVEKSLSGYCEPAVAESSIKIQTFGRIDREVGEDHPRLVETDYSPRAPNNYPVCKSSYPYSEVRSMFYEYEPNFYPDFFPYLTRVTISADSELRQFGIKILDGSGNTYDDGASRPVYAKVYSWLDAANQKHYIATRDNADSTTYTTTSYNGGILHLPVGTVAADARYIWPGFPASGRTGIWKNGSVVGQGHMNLFYNSWSEQDTCYTNLGTYPGKDKSCTGGPVCPAVGTSCQTGYTPMRASSATGGNRCGKFNKGGSYSGKCPILPGDGSYTDTRGEYDRLDCPQAYTCKRIVGQGESASSYKSNWKPELGDSAVSFQPDSWSANNQKVWLYQEFSFTVDKDGAYYFTRCPDSNLYNEVKNGCKATMEINGGGYSSANGWDDHNYTAGTVYKAKFTCTSGTCYYGLGVAPKSTLPSNNGNTAQIVYVPLVYKEPPNDKQCNEECTGDGDCVEGLGCIDSQCKNPLHYGPDDKDNDCIACTSTNLSDCSAGTCENPICVLGSNPSGYDNYCSTEDKPVTTHYTCPKDKWGLCSDSICVQQCTVSDEEYECADKECGCSGIPDFERARSCNTGRCSGEDRGSGSCDVNIGFSSSSGDECRVMKVNSQGLITEGVDKVSCPE